MDNIALDNVPVRFPCFDVVVGDGVKRNVDRFVFVLCFDFDVGGAADRQGDGEGSCRRSLLFRFRLLRKLVNQLVNDDIEPTS